VTRPALASQTAEPFPPSPLERSLARAKHSVRTRAAATQSNGTAHGGRRNRSASEQRSSAGPGGPFRFGSRSPLSGLRIPCAELANRARVINALGVRPRRERQ
jgi:hypothetical protein